MYAIDLSFTRILTFDSVNFANLNILFWQLHQFSKLKVKFLLIARNAPWLISSVRRADNISKFWPFVRVHSAGQLSINGSIWLQLNVEPNIPRCARYSLNHMQLQISSASQNASLKYRLIWFNLIWFEPNMQHCAVLTQSWETINQQGFALSEYN